MPIVILAVSESVAAWLVRTSWQAAVLVAIVAIVQVAFRKVLPPRWAFALWMLVVVRLLMPALPASPWSVFNVAIPEAAARNAVVEPVQPQATDGLTIKITRTFDVDADADSLKAPVAPESPAAAFDWRRALLAVWLAGAIVLVLRIIVAHVLLARRLRGAPAPTPDVIDLLDGCQREMRVRGNVRVIPTDAVGGPALFGFFKPKVLVPPAMLRDLTPKDLRFVFLHELAHLKRRDTLMNIPLSLAQALHWFNPLAWFALSRCRTERELACDAMVLELTNGPAQHGYGDTILRLAEMLAAARPRHATLPAALGLLPTRSQLTRRITMISAFRRSASSRSWSLLPMLLLVGVASCTLTDKASRDTAAGAAPTTKPTETATAGRAAEKQSLRVEYDEEKVIGVDIATRMALEKRHPELNLDNVPFADVIDALRDLTNTNIFVNWRALEAEGIDRQARVTTRLRDVKFAKALDVVLNEVGGNTVKLGYTIDDGVITISTKNDLAKNTLTRVYDIRDLIAEVPDYTPESEPLPAPTTKPEPTVTEQLVREITQLIQEVVEPDAWRDRGGSIASIKELERQLIITATPEMHEQIKGLLGQLRESRGVQVTVEARFITVDQAAMDQALGGRLKGTMGKSGEATVWQLDDDEVRKVLDSTQKAAQATILTAPRLTLFSGQRGHVTVSTQTAYVSSFTVIKKDGGETRYEPKIDVISSGITLDLRATMTSDRKYATLTLKPQLSRLESLIPVTYPDAKDLTIQVPRLSVHELQTTLTVPDRGTALIGGFTESLQSTAAAFPNVVKTTVSIPEGGKLMIDGVPTTQPANANDVLKVPPSHNLYLLVKPTLIVQSGERPTEFPIHSTKIR